MQFFWPFPHHVNKALIVVDNNTAYKNCSLNCDFYSKLKQYRMHCTVFIKKLCFVFVWTYWESFALSVNTDT